MRKIIFICVLMALGTTACADQEPFCPLPTGTRQYLTLSPGELPIATPGILPDQVPVEIGGKSILVDKIVQGPLCNDNWSGTVYVTCDVQVYPWQENPTFLEDCDLTIAPNTVIYVASHNNTAYYNGCSCHTGEISEP